MSVALAALLAALCLPGLAGAAKTKPHKHKKPKGPTLQQKIHAAVAKAERSPDLWATVNCCGSCQSSTPSTDVVGIRGQMPGLGITASTMSMSISVEYWNYTDNAFESANASIPVSLGVGTHGVRQGGANFPFSPPPSGTTYLVRGTIAFTWKVGSKVVGSVTRNTGHGYTNVGYSNPPGLSEGSCTLT